jgi:hypothetical protein
MPHLSGQGRTHPLKAITIRTITHAIQTLQAKVKRGKAHGAILRTHTYPDGSFVASRSRFEDDYVRVKDMGQLIQLWQQGFKVRMSATLAGKYLEPRLIAAESIELTTR